MHLYSRCRCDANKTYNVYDLLIRRVYEDSAEEPFDMTELSMYEVEEFHVEQDIVQKDHNSERKAPLPDRGEISNRDTITWLSDFWLQNGRASKQNKINTRTTASYTFLIGRLDDAKDLFQHLYGRKALIKGEYEAFFGVCFLR